MIKKKINGSIMNFANMSEAQSGDNSITAFVEVSPAEAAHNVDDYIVYNHIIYQVIDDISIGDTLVVNTNIEQAVLPEGTVIYSNDEQGNTGSLSYNDLSDKPQIAGTTLQGDKSLADLGIASEGAIEDVYAVMGEMGAKNLNKFPYKNGGAGDVWSTNGIDFTVLADGSIDVNRASSSSNPAFFRCGISTDNFNPIYLEAGKKYILSGSVSDVGISLRDSTNTNVITSSSGEEELFNCSNSGNYFIIISVAKDASPVHALVKPMLRLASDTDDTYQQYAKTNKQLTDEISNKVDKVAGKGLSTNDYDNTEKGKVADNTGAIEAIVNEYGAKNLLPNNATSQTINGVTFTVNADGSVTANGTATDTTFFNLSNKDFGNEAIGTYLNMPKEANGFIISDGIVDEHEQSCGIGYDPNNNNVIFILIMSGYTANNLTFYPMIRDARITDPTFVPYAMTNRELTDAVSPVKFTATPSSIVTVAFYNRFRKIGKLILAAFNMQITGATANATLYSNMPLPDEQFEILLGNESTEFRARLTVSGELIIDGAAPPDGFYAGEMIYTTI